MKLILNIILKGLIQEPRPSFDSEKVKLATNYYAKKYFFQNGIPFNMFGMPSGHAQNIFFTTVYIYLVLQNDWILLTYLLLALFTSYTRITYKRHYLMQVIIGSIIGIFIGYLFYYSASKNIMGILKFKKDDNALF